MRPQYDSTDVINEHQFFARHHEHFKPGVDSGVAFTCYDVLRSQYLNDLNACCFYQLHCIHCRMHVFQHAPGSAHCLWGPHVFQSRFKRISTDFIGYALRLAPPEHRGRGSFYYEGACDKDPHDPFSYPL